MWIVCPHQSLSESEGGRVIQQSSLYFPFQTSLFQNQGIVGSPCYLDAAIRPLLNVNSLSDVHKVTGRIHAPWLIKQKGPIENPVLIPNLSFGPNMQSHKQVMGNRTSGFGSPWMKKISRSLCTHPRPLLCLVDAWNGATTTFF